MGAVEAVACGFKLFSLSVVSVFMSGRYIKLSKNKQQMRVNRDFVFCFGIKADFFGIVNI